MILKKILQRNNNNNITSKVENLNNSKNKITNNLNICNNSSCDHIMNNIKNTNDKNIKETKDKKQMTNITKKYNSEIYDNSNNINNSISMNEKRNENSNNVENEIEMKDINNKTENSNDINLNIDINENTNETLKIKDKEEKRNIKNSVNKKEKNYKNIVKKNNEFINVMNSSTDNFDTNEYIEKCIKFKNNKYNLKVDTINSTLNELIISDTGIQGGNLFFIVICILSGINPFYYPAIRKAAYDAFINHEFFVKKYGNNKIKEIAKDFTIDGLFVPVEMLYPFSVKYKINLVIEYEYLSSSYEDKIKTNVVYFNNSNSNPWLYILLNKTEEGKIDRTKNLFLIDTNKNYLIKNEIKEEFMKYVEDYKKSSGISQIIKDSVI